MTNKKFKKAAMALALTACVAATPLAANAETPENAVPVENKERSEAETPAQQASESVNTAPVENQEHENAEGILEDRETEDKKITTDVEYTDREFTYNEDGTVKSEESSGAIVQKEMDKSTEAASGETAGEGKDSEVLLKLLKQARPPRKARASKLPMRTSPNRSRTPRARSSALPPRRSAPNRKLPSHPPARTLKSW